MLIREIGIRGFKSFGNNEQTIKLNTEKGELILLTGGNGRGKSVVKTTEIEVEIEIDKFSLEEFENFLVIMEGGSEYIKYIKENNNILYEQYINKQKSIK